MDDPLSDEDPALTRALKNDEPGPRPSPKPLLPCKADRDTDTGDPRFSVAPRTPKQRQVAEQVAAAATQPWWFQVYMMRDRELTRLLVSRAAAAGAHALVLTGDTPYVGAKSKVAGVRFAVPEDQFLVNVTEHLEPGREARWATAQNPSITVDVIRRLQDVSGLPVVVKGVLRADDAQKCIDAGASGILVSNHGGRQLSRALPSALALADVVDAVEDRVPVLVDGGIRSGVDVLVALALGARVALIGRPALWALAAHGDVGVADLLNGITADLAHAMALVGAPRADALDRSHLWAPPTGRGDVAGVR